MIVDTGLIPPSSLLEQQRGDLVYFPGDGRGGVEIFGLVQELFKQLWAMNICARSVLRFVPKPPPPLLIQSCCCLNHLTNRLAVDKPSPLQRRRVAWRSCVLFSRDAGRWFANGFLGLRTRKKIKKFQPLNLILESQTAPGHMKIIVRYLPFSAQYSSPHADFPTLAQWMPASWLMALLTPQKRARW